MDIGPIVLPIQSNRQQVMPYFPLYFVSRFFFQLRRIVRLIHCYIVWIWITFRGSSRWLQCNMLSTNSFASFLFIVSCLSPSLHICCLFLFREYLGLPLQDTHQPCTGPVNYIQPHNETLCGMCCIITYIGLIKKNIYDADVQNEAKNDNVHCLKCAWTKWCYFFFTVANLTRPLNTRSLWRKCAHEF